MIPIIGLIMGIIIGILLPLNILPPGASDYLSVAILACLDSVFGGIKSSLENKFDTDIFISGFFGNAILAAGLTYLGERLNVPIYIAAVVVFGGRIFQNFAIMRREIIISIREKKKIVENDKMTNSGGENNEN